MLTDHDPPGLLRRPAGGAPGPQCEPAAREGGDLIVRYLESIGVRHAFGIPGGAVEPLFNAFARSERRGGLRAIVARHETGAAFMAEGYARASGRIGVCVATSGPGATNLMTGVASAYENGIPLLVLTGQPALPLFGRRSFQESGCTGIDIVGMFRYCTCYDTLVSHRDQLEQKLTGALMRALQMQRPAHLSIPVDVLRSTMDAAEPAFDLRAAMEAPALVDESGVRRACDELRRALRPVFMIGGGCADAVEPVMELIERSGALFVTAPDGKGLVDPRHPAYRGVFGFSGHRSADAALRDGTDLVVAIGTSMSEWNSGAWSDAVLNERLVHIDASPEHLARSAMARLHVPGHIRSNCERLAALLREDGRERKRGPAPQTRCFDNDPDKRWSDAVPLKPQRLMRELSLRFPRSTQFVAEPGNSMNWAVHCLEREEQRLRPVPRDGAERRGPDPGWLRIAMEFCAMGWAIGAAVGMARANPERPVVCITGDGSFLMNGQEITVAAAEGLPVVFVILNDGALGMVKHGQRLTGAEPTAFGLPPVDFRRMAEAMGIPGHVIVSPADFEALDFDAMLTRKGPTLLDVRIDGEETPPMKLRVKTITMT